MRRGKRKEQTAPKPTIPKFEDYDVAVWTALQMPDTTVGCGAVRVEGSSGGGCALWVNDSIAKRNIQLGIMHLRRLKAYVQGNRLRLSVRIDVHATMENSWYLAGGIRRRTHPGLHDLYKSFTGAEEVEAWLETNEGHSATFSPDFRWFVYASPPK